MTDNEPHFQEISKDLYVLDDSLPVGYYFHTAQNTH